MSVELNMEVSQSEYQPNSEVNRLEVYESLLLDTQSALWREVLHRKEMRSSKNTNPQKTEIQAEAGTETTAEIFDIDSEEEEEEEEKSKNKHTKGQGHDVSLSFPL